MGSKCFRPIKQRNQPVYITSINKAMSDAQIINQSKVQTRQRLIDEIIMNENQKGNLKRLFQHLGFHQGRVIDAIKQCSRRVSFDKSFSAVVIASVFCALVVKMISTKKLKLYESTIQQNNNLNQLQSKRNLMLSSHGLRNLIYELQSYFFQLVIKILVYSKEKKIHDNMSQMLIQYTNACGDKIVAKKQLKNILDLYLNVVFQKNIQLINKKSFLAFFAYSVLLSKSKSQLFTSQFIQKHFHFILKIFFQLQDSKAKSKSLIQSQDFFLFQQSIESIVKQFILFSLQNKKIKQHILMQIMQQSDNQKFVQKKMMKLQRLIKQNLNTYSSEHFMMDWLQYMLKYIGKKVDNQNESIRQSLMQSMHEASIQAAISSYGSLKNNLISTQSKANAVDTLGRWFQCGLLDCGRAMKNCSARIFQALLLNLYGLYNNGQYQHQIGGALTMSITFNNNNDNNNITSTCQQVSHSAKNLLLYIISQNPQRIKQIILLINKQLRKHKNQFYLFQSQNLTFSRSSMRSRQFPIFQDDAAQILWRNNIRFLLQMSNKVGQQVRLSQEQMEELYAPIAKHSKSSVNLVYLIQLAAIGVRHIVDHKQVISKGQLSQLHNKTNKNNSQLIYNFLCSLLNSMRVNQQDIQYQYLHKLSQKIKILAIQLIHKQQQIICQFFKYCFMNLHKQNGQQLYIQILLLVIVISSVIEKHKDNNKKRLQKLQWFLDDLLSMIKKDEFTAKDIYELYDENKSLFDVSLRISARLQSIKLKTLQHLQNKQQNVQTGTKSVTNNQGSVVSSRFQIQESNPDKEFVGVCKMVNQG